MPRAHRDVRIGKKKRFASAKPARHSHAGIETVRRGQSQPVENSPDHLTVGQCLGHPAGIELVDRSGARGRTNRADRRSSACTGCRKPARRRPAAMNPKRRISVTAAVMLFVAPLRVIRVGRKYRPADIVLFAGCRDLASASASLPMIFALGRDFRVLFW